MTQATAIAFPEENLVGWERTLYAFLVEKRRRSGSDRTVQGYSSMLQDFFGRVGKASDKVTVQEVFVWAHSTPGAVSPETAATYVQSPDPGLNEYHQEDRGKDGDPPGGETGEEAEEQKDAQGDLKDGEAQGHRVKEKAGKKSISVHSEHCSGRV